MLGVFVTSGMPPSGGDLVGRVEVLAYPVRGWNDDPRVQRLAPELREPRLERLVTMEPAPVTFVGSIGSGQR